MLFKSKSSLALCSTVLMMAVTTVVALTASAQPLSEWSQFQSKTSVYMNTPPHAYDPKGQLIQNSPFSASSISSGAFARKKFEMRALTSANPARRNPMFFASEAGWKIKLANYFDTSEFSAQNKTPMSNLDDIDRLIPKSIRTDVQPWSGSYWPIYQGGMAARYATTQFNTMWNTWPKSQIAYKDEGDLKSIIDGDGDVTLEDLSPAEKYDLLLEDPRDAHADRSGSLTTTMWQDGAQYMAQAGSVETWMGYCHGWAPASLIEKRPSHSFESASAAGPKLKFFPSDVKALSTLLWAKGSFDQRSLGGRCGEKNPKTDPDSGRLLDPECFDVNPGLWHLAVVNQLGQLKRGFVIDATYDYQVWNQPMFGYSYTYFNPQTGEPADTIENALVSRAKYTKDKFKKFRGSGAAYFIGVQMKIDYGAESSADHRESDTPADDHVVSVTYLYDLELDKNHEVIGGEWFKNAHPDFIWTATFDSRPVSENENQLGNDVWSPTDELPKFWRDLGIQTARTTGEPVAKIVEALVNEASVH